MGPLHDKPGLFTRLESLISHQGLTDAICLHLETLLNSRPGFSLTVPDYGFSDLSSFDGSERSLELLRRELSRVIAAFEPRLIDVTVEFVPNKDNPFSICFDIVAHLRPDLGRNQTLYRGTVESGRGVKVTRLD